MRFSKTDHPNDLNEDYLVEMASIGGLTLSIGAVYLIVTPVEGNIPHFHVHLKSDGSSRTRDICIKFDEPDYFLHGSHTDTLNSGDRKKLYKYLRGNYGHGLSNWEYLAITWDHDHPNDIIKASSCPNYLLLPDKN